MPNELKHHGILGMKWGVRRYQNKDGTKTNAGKNRYKSKGMRAKIARAQNNKVDRSFETWKYESQKKQKAIDLGKQYNLKKINYYSNKSKSLKKELKDSKKVYKKALRDNTIYRKGSVRKEVGSDLSRKYLSEAKKIKKKMDANPSDKKLQKQYNELMSKHDIERSKARRAQEVGANRSRKIAALRRIRNVAVATVVGTAAVGVGVKAANRYLNANINISYDQVKSVADNVKGLLKYLY